MADLLFLAVTAVFFLAAIAYVLGCERLKQAGNNESR